jgi:hypothetical protein
MITENPGPRFIEVTPQSCYFILATSDDDRQAWDFPAIGERAGGQELPAAALNIGGRRIPLTLGTQRIVGTGPNVALTVGTSGPRTAAKFGFNPWNHTNTVDGFPVKAVVRGNREFDFVVLDNGSRQPVRLACDLATDPDVTDAYVFLDCDGDLSTRLPVGNSKPAVRVQRLGFYFRPWTGTGGLTVAFERVDS